ncbi:MAG: response regulator transcription factor [Candidatus Obscuribacterales bacterium]|nr:response regulator transcription factor [Candidatus Obscuribacterales bacterium]
MARILLVEDDLELSERLQEWLIFEWHTVDATETGEAAMELLLLSTYDVILLDRQLQGEMSGLDVCQRFRARGGLTPILFLTGLTALSDKVTGFESGADDYLTKPFQWPELSLRIKALLRRPPIKSASVLMAGDLEMDSETHQVSRAGRPIRLSRTEYQLLELFLSHPTHVFTTDSILKRIWPVESERSPEALRTLLKKLRSKIDIEGQPSLIENYHGVGYSLQQPAKIESESN